MEFEQQVAEQPQGEKVDFVKDVFAKFGLRTDLYSNPNALMANEAAFFSKEESMQVSKTKRFLDSLPDYGFLLDHRVSIPKEFFVQ
jgi:hypothetical protein